MTTATPVNAPAEPAVGEVLVLAEGVELIGEYEDSGFRRPQHLARRADGQMIQLTELLSLVAAACDGRRDLPAVAEAVSERAGRRVSPRSVQYLVEHKLRPLGVLAQADGSTPELGKREPVMALRHRRPLLSEQTVNTLARGFTWLHRLPVQAVLLLALAAFDAWLFGVHGIAGGLRAVLYSPMLLLGVLGSIVVATAFHEIGHASACRYSGARPGVMGVGVYLVWPAFYCDVTDAYRLSRGGRLRTDLGGVYFNGIVALLAGAAYFATGQEALLLVTFLQHTIVLQQLMPLLRFDGYYVLSDLTGVPDILSRIKPIFRSLVPGADPEPQVQDLKPWVRVVVTAYLLVLVPTLLFMIVSTVLAAPRMVATAYDSMGLQLDRLHSAHDAPEITLGAVQIGALVLPLAAITVSLARSGRMATRGIAAWSSGSAVRRATAIAGAVAVAAGAGYVWWPNGDYQPLRPGERGTIGEAVASIPKAPGGRPSFTPERAAEFERVPTVREEGAAHRRHEAAGDPAGPRSAPADPGPDPVGEPAGQDNLPADDWAGDDTTAPEDSTPTPTATATPAPTTTTQPPAATTPAPTATSTPTATPSPTATTPSATAPSATTTPALSATGTPEATTSPTAVATATPSPTP